MIPIAEPCLGKEELDNVVEAVKGGWISSKGRFIPEFEEEFATYCGVRHGVATSNGTVALHLALKTLGISGGDEVIVPTLTFIATANAVAYCNAKPVFIDSHPDYWCLDPARIEEKITPKTKAIIPVHLYGHPCDMDAIMHIARRHNLFVIEDAAEAHGAEYRGKKVGSFGDISCFSFYGNKIITTGEGGMCLTDNKWFAERMAILRDHGMSPTRRYWHDEVGFNYRMTNMQAAIGVAQVKKVDKFVAGKREIAGLYRALLKDVEGITLPPEMPWAKSVFWMYSILVKDEFPVRRDQLMEELRQREIDSRPLFHPIHRMPAHENEESLTVAEEISRRGINLPSSVNLEREGVEKVVDVITMVSSRGKT